MSPNITKFSESFGFNISCVYKKDISAATTKRFFPKAFSLLRRLETIFYYAKSVWKQFKKSKFCIAINIFASLSSQPSVGLITWIFSSKSDAETDDLIGAFSSWVIQNIQVGYPRKQEFHIRYNKLTTMVENKDHLL